MSWARWQRRRQWPASIPWLHLGETRYHDPRPLMGLSRSAAALLLASQTAADSEAALRRANARALLDAISEHPLLVKPIAVADDTRPGYLRLPIRIHGGASVVHGLSAGRRGVAPGYPSTLAELPAVRNSLRTAGPLPGANALVRELVTLPTHGLTTHQDRREILDAIIAARRVTPSSTRHSPRNTTNSSRVN
jgi:dTDP-4-amino-4,6-dideoxygalactose transaminase